MRKDFSPVILLVFALVAGFAGEAPAQDTTVIMNVTNPCIDSTFKSYTPNRTNPSSILIDRRVNINPLTACTPGVAVNASCNRDNGTPMFLEAVVTAGQIMNNPACSWDCGVVCGTIVTDGSNGLPVELMDFAIEDEEPAEDGTESGAGTGDRKSS